MMYGFSGCHERFRTSFGRLAELSTARLSSPWVRREQRFNPSHLMADRNLACPMAKQALRVYP